MAISSVLNSGLSGIQQGFESLQKNAGHIANTTSTDEGGSQSLVESIIGLKSSVIQIKASMQVVKTYDDVLGTLLDVKA